MDSVNHQKTFNSPGIGDDDVISFRPQELTYVKPVLVKYSDFMNAVNPSGIFSKIASFLNESLCNHKIDVYSSYEIGHGRQKSGRLQDWFSNGIECEILRVGSSGWQRGKLKLKVEIIMNFVPDEIEENKKEEIESPLDEIRQMLDGD